jgi:outer membrane lipopolysaccharide assembly protein LptE/RlpB
MKKNLLLLLAAVTLFLNGCGVYSFTGASISPEVKSFSVQYFTNRASLVQPTLSQAFTEKLKERFISLANLRQVDADGDIQFEGYISDYRTSPVAIQGTETAALNRLTISVNVKFTNTKDAKQNFESTFTRYADYDSKKSLTEVELSLIDEINRQLIDDIFNKSVSNW